MRASTRAGPRMAAALCACLASASLPATAREIVLPDDADIVNVKRDFGARGDGRADDTDAIRKAVKRGIEKSSRYAAPAFVYFPKGTYRVTGPIESKVEDGGWSGGWRAGMLLVGESREKTVIRLADRQAGYGDAKSPRYVIATGSESDKRGTGIEGGGNRAFRHAIINLTVDTGRGNPGAVGIDFVASNRGTVEDVTVRSGDGAGFCGLRLERWWPGPALVKRVHIDGFDHGVRVAHYQYSMTFEHVTLTRQRKAGVLNNQNVLFFRRLASRNTVPVIESISDHGSIVLIDSRFDGGAAEAAAITSKAKLFIRNLTTTGYGRVVVNQVGHRRGVEGGAGETTVKEYTSHDVKSLFESPARSLGLPVEETPEYDPAGLDEWASVVAHGATPGKERGKADDDAPGIQAAIDSGKPVVYLPNGAYTVRRPIIVRGAVRKIMGMQSSVDSPKDVTVDPLLRFEGGTAEAVVIEHLRLEGAVEHASSRALAFRHCDLRRYRNAPEGTGKLFLEDTIGPKLNVTRPQSVWCRQYNTEFGSVPQIRNAGGTLWILGLKTEVGGEREHWIMIQNLGGRVELLGALFYPLNSAKLDRTPCIVNDRGQLSATYAMNGGNYPVHIRERRGDEWRELARRSVKGRGPALYVGYTEAGTEVELPSPPAPPAAAPPERAAAEPEVTKVTEVAETAGVEARPAPSAALEVRSVDAEPKPEAEPKAPDPRPLPEPVTRSAPPLPEPRVAPAPRKKDNTLIWVAIGGGILLAVVAFVFGLAGKGQSSRRAARGKGKAGRGRLR